MELDRQILHIQSNCAIAIACIDSDGARCACAGYVSDSCANDASGGKSESRLTSMPVTASENVTVKSTLVALVGFGLAERLLSTVGGVVSMLT